MHIKKFLEHINTNKVKLPGRSRVIESESVNDVINKYAPWYNINSETPIYRGVKSNNIRRNDNFLIIEPDIHKRISVDSENYYNLIMDNDTKWKYFPKRSHSIICTTNKISASNYGEVYRVIPIIENSIIAIAPTHDIWWSFRNTFDSLKLNATCYDCMGTGQLEWNKNDNIECSNCNGLGTEKITSLSAFNIKLKNDFNLIEKYDYTWSEFKNKVGDYIEVISKIFDPKLNNFELKKYNNDTFIYGDKEVWTDSKCILIRESLIS